VIRESISRGLRARVMERDQFRCRRCGCGPNDRKLNVDHIVPVAQGGRSVDWNLQTLCDACNGGKSARDPHRHDTQRGFPSDPRVAVMAAAPAPPPSTPPAHPLVGMFVHTFKDGKLHYQGKVLKVGGDVVVLQLYGWLNGDPTNCQAFNLEETKGWRLYSSARDWRYGAAAIQHQQDPKTYDHPDADGGWFDKLEAFFAEESA
jgi:hypothetical protein